MDRFEKAIAVYAVLTALASVLIVWLLTSGEWYWQTIAGLASAACCWLGLGITSQFAEDE